MSLYSKYVLPRIIDATCSTKPIARQPKKIVPSATGRVLEIGIGSGLNLDFMDRTSVKTVLGLDPSPELMAIAQSKAERSGVDFRPLLADAASIPLEDSEVDTVLVTYTLCSIDALDTALYEIRRVLRPDGKLVFCEHGLAPDASIARWQRRLTPVWKRFSGGCRLDRDTRAIITDAGFSIARSDQMDLPGTMRIVGYNVWGTAIRR